VLDRLQKVEDEAVQYALQHRQERAETALHDRLEAEAAAYKEAQVWKADEARRRLSRARLVAFYCKHAPDKESNNQNTITTTAIVLRRMNSNDDNSNNNIHYDGHGDDGRCVNDIVHYMNDNFGCRRL
jgi:hypothetical protein